MEHDYEGCSNYIQRVTDIYVAIKDKTIKKTYTSLKIPYTLTDKDKVAVAFFLGGFFTNSKIKDYLYEANDVNLNRLMSFACLEQQELKKLPSKEDYDVVYASSSMVSFFREMIVNIGSQYRINKICPELLYLSLSFTNFSEANFYNLLAQKCGLNCLTFSKHSIFRKLEDYLIKNEFVIPLSEQEKERFKGIPEMLVEKTSIQPRRYDKYLKKPVEDLPDPELLPVSFLSKDKSHLWQILDDILKKFIGQEETVENLFYNIVNNQQLSTLSEISDGERSIIFLDGPTGTGKTAITREITQKLNIPFTSTSIVNYSSTGYVGGDITDTLVDLYHKAGDNVSLAQRGIIVLDELDKLATGSDGLEMKKAVQQQLLDFLGGGKYIVDVGENLFDKKKIEFDTSKITFVCLGALSTLREEKQDTKRSLGFSTESKDEDKTNYSITPDDLIGIGLERELVGRFNTYLHTNDYSKEDLVRILKESSISPLIGLEKWINMNGKTLEIDEDAYEAIAEHAYNLNTGARSLQTVVNNIRTYYMKEVLRGDSPVVHLDKDTINKINENSINRRVRG